MFDRLYSDFWMEVIINMWYMQALVAIVILYACLSFAFGVVWSYDMEQY